MAYAPNVGVHMSDAEVRAHRQHTKQKAFDVRPLMINMMEDMLNRRDRRDKRPLEPHSSYARDVLPPMALRGDISDAICTRIARSCVNKERFIVNQVMWSPEGRRLVTGTADGKLTLWDGTTYAFDTITEGHDTPIISLTWSPNTDWFLAADDQGLISVWSSTFTKTEALKGHEGAVRGLSFSPTGLKFCSCSDDRTVKIWDFWTLKADSTLNGHHYNVRCCEWHPFHSLIVSAGQDNLVKLWDPRQARELRTITAHNNGVFNVKWNPKGNWLLTTSKDMNVKLFDIRMMNEFQSINCGDYNQATSAAWHPFHEKLFVTGHYDGGLTYFAVGDDIPLARIPNAHKAAVQSLEFSPTGQTLASASKDKYTKFWVRYRPGDTAEQYEFQGSDAMRAPTANYNDSKQSAPGQANFRQGGYQQSYPRSGTYNHYNNSQQYNAMPPTYYQGRPG